MVSNRREVNMQIRILVVDDEIKVLNAIKRVFNNKDYNMTFVDNSVKAKKLIDNNDFDIIIADQVMPQITGVELLIYAKSKIKNIVGILITGHLDMNVLINAVNDANVWKYISKPWVNADFEQIVEDAILLKKERDITLLSKQFIENRNKDLRVPKRSELELKDDSIAQGIRLLLRVIESKDKNLLNHSRNVAELSVKFAEFLGLIKYDIDIVYYSGLLHDIGKIAIRDSIIYKKEKLNEEEFDNIKSHPLVSANLIREVHGLEKIAIIVEQHHENYDGRGYPNGLINIEIYKEAVIISIVDMYVALMEKRVYKKKLKKGDVLDIINKTKNNKFSEKIVNHFFEFIETASF